MRRFISTGLLGTALFAIFFVAPHMASATAYITAPDTTGTVGWYASMVLDGNSYPVVAYYDSTNADLKVMHCNDEYCDGGNESIETVDSTGAVGFYPDIELDASGYPVISYYDLTNGDLKLAHCNDVNCNGGNESIQTVDSTGDVGAFSQLELESVTGLPIIGYQDVTNADLKVVHCNDVDCDPVAGGAESPNTVASTGDVGRNLSMALDGLGLGNPVLASSQDSSDLRIINCSATDCSTTSSSETVAINSGEMSLAIDPTTAFAVVAVNDLDTGDLVLVQCSNFTCSSAVTNTPDSTGSVGRYPSLQLASTTRYPIISYIDTTNTALKLLFCDDLACAGTETPLTVDTRDSGYTSMQLVSIAQGPTVAYFQDSTDDLQILQCDNATCTADANLSVTTQGSETGPVDAVFTVTLASTNNTGQAITFDVAFTGTATAGTDYTDVSGVGVLSVADGATTGTLTVPITDDSTDDDSETIIGTISNASTDLITIDTASATATITDNDDPVVASSDSSTTRRMLQPWNTQTTTTPKAQDTTASFSAGQLVSILETLSLSSSVVQSLQEMLTVAGYSPGPIDGVWGPQTKAALTNFFEAVL